MTDLLFADKEFWIACRIAEAGDRCWRYDDGTLVLVREDQGRLHPLALPPRREPVRLAVQIGPNQAPSAPLQAPEGQPVEVQVRVRNTGTEPVYWLRLVPQAAAQGHFLFLPPPRLVKLDPGAEQTLTGKVSFAAAYDQPAPAAATLDLALEVHQGEPIPILVPVQGLVPEPLVIAGPALNAATHTLTLRLANRGGQDLNDVRADARVSTAPSGVDRELEAVELAPLPAGGEASLSLTLPNGANVDPWSRLTLTLTDNSQPRHVWRFADLPIPGLTWRLTTP